MSVRKVSTIEQGLATALRNVDTAALRRKANQPVRADAQSNWLAEEVNALLPGLAQLAEPGSLFEREGDLALGWAARISARGASGKESFLEGLAHALALALTNVDGPHGVHREAPVRFAWLHDLVARLPAPPTGATHAERLNAVLRLDESELAAALFDDIAPTSTRASDALLVRASVPADQSARLSTRMKNVNAALFSAGTFDLAEQTGALAAAIKAGRVVVSAHDDVQLTKRMTAEQPGFASGAVKALGGTSGFTQGDEVLALMTRAMSNPDLPPEAVAAQVPIPQWPNGRGERFAIALLEAARLIFPLCDGMANAFETPAHDEALGALTAQDNAGLVLKEGIVTMAQAIALLMSQEPAGISVPEALDRLVASQLVNTLAGVAPFGVIAPLASGGHLPDSGPEVSEHGRLLLPAALRDVCEHAKAHRELPSKDAKSDYARDLMRPDAINRTETLRGCPVASLAFIIDESGAGRLADTTALDALTRSYVEVVKALWEGELPKAHAAIALSDLR